MPKFKFNFRGREAGAIGITYNITATYQCKNMGEAKFMLYTDYSSIHIFSAYKDKQQLPVPGAIEGVEVIDNGYKGKHSTPNLPDHE